MLVDAELCRRCLSICLPLVLLSVVDPVTVVWPLHRAPAALCGEGAAHCARAGHRQPSGGEEVPVYGGYAVVFG